MYRKLTAAGSLAPLATIGTMAATQSSLEVAAIAAAIVFVSYLTSNSAVGQTRWAMSMQTTLIIASVIVLVLTMLHHDRLDTFSNDTHGLAISNTPTFGNKELVSVTAGSSVSEVPDVELRWREGSATLFPGTPQPQSVNGDFDLTALRMASQTKRTRHTLESFVSEPRPNTRRAYTSSALVKLSYLDLWIP
jgi:hypothetical protein